MQNLLIYLHCKKCKEEKPDNIPIDQYSNLSIGFSENKIVIACNRHQHTLIVLDVTGNRELLTNLVDQKMSEILPKILH